jgi:glycosyltransferase involved in cell wall biosynthesis
LKVALVSTATSPIGSMGRYGELVREALAEHVPQIECVPIGLRGEPARSGSRTAGRMRLIADAAGSARRLRDAAGIDVYHVLDGSFLYLVRGIPWRRTVVAVHDLIPGLQIAGALGPRPPGIAARVLVNLTFERIRRAGFVYAVSNSTASDLARLTHRAADAVIYNPVARSLAQPDEPHAARASEGGRPFVLHVGNNSFYKNRRAVVAIFKAIHAERPDMALILAGAEPSAALREAVAQAGLEDHVTFVVSPSDQALAGLYRMASLLVFPSLYEGFGWPPLEAAGHGCPVVCSSAGSLPEIMGDAALFAAPDDPDAFAAAALSILNDRKLAADVARRGHANLARFGRAEFARQLAGAYGAVA